MKFKVILFFVFLCFPALISAQKTLKLPYLDRGACPFECCTYREWIAQRNIPLRKEMNSTSPVIFRVKKGERVQGLTGVVVTSKAGIYQAVNATKFGEQNIPKGSRLLMLTYLGEGFYKTWFRGRMYEDDVLGNKDLKMISEPKSVWWVKVKNKKGQIGWTNMSGGFDNQDACG